MRRRSLAGSWTIEQVTGRDGHFALDEDDVANDFQTVMRLEERRPK